MSSFGPGFSRSLLRFASMVLAFLAMGADELAAQAKTTRQVPVESLIYDLKNPDPVRRQEAARSLGDNKIQRATPDLVAVVDDADVDVRREIIIALDKMSDVRALPAFVKVSRDRDKDIRERCLRAMLALYLPQESGLSPTISRLANFFNPWSDEWSEVVIEPGLRVDPSAVEALGGRLSDSEESLRMQAARALGILKARDAVPALVGTLRQDTSNAVKFESIRALRKIGDPSVGPELINYLRYGDAKVRNEAVYALGRLRHRQAVSELMRLFEQESAKPRKERDANYAARLLDAIAFLADPASRDLLAREKQNPDALLRLRACEGIARLGDASLTTEVSRDYLREKDAKVRTAQAFALYRMGRKEYFEVIGTALGSNKTSNEARQYLVEFKPEELPDLYTLAKRDSVGVREAVAEALGHIGDAQAIPVLQELSKDNRGQIASNANQAIRRLNARLSAS